MATIQRAAIIGAGAMGAFYASKFYDLDPRCVSLVAGGSRYERLKQTGLVVNAKPYPIPVVHPENPLEPPDLIIVAVKSHQLPGAIEDLRGFVGEGTTILSVMNGIESEEQIGAVFGMEKVLYAVAIGIDAVRSEEGVRYAGQGKLLFGESKNDTISARVRALRAFFDRADIHHETPGDMIRVLWWKFMVNVGINQASAVIRGPYGTFQRSRHARDLMDSAMREVITVAKAANVDLKEEDIEAWHDVLAGINPEGKTSMLQDMEAGRKTELDIFAGRVISLGIKYRIPTPVNDTLYRIIRASEEIAGTAP